jgi:hypothetical protein
MPVAILRRDPDRLHNERVDAEVEKELAELAAIASRVVRRNAANERDLAEIRKRLPGLREKDVGPADLERAIHSVYVAGTISRWTKDVAPPSNRGKKKAEAAAGES